jgi:hypothetical protein
MISLPFRKLCLKRFPTVRECSDIEHLFKPSHAKNRAQVNPQRTPHVYGEMGVIKRGSVQAGKRALLSSDHKPSVSTNFEATYNILFAAVDAASVQIPMLSQLQMTDYAGIRPVFGPITVETGVAYYSYPGSVIDTSYPEYYVAPKYTLSSKFTIEVNVYYAPNYSRTGAWENFD